MFLHRDDLESILEFMNSFPEYDTVEVQSDSSSGIGTIITAVLHHVDVNGHRVSISKEISSVENW